MVSLHSFRLEVEVQPPLGVSSQEQRTYFFAVFNPPDVTAAVERWSYKRTVLFDQLDRCYPIGMCRFNFQMKSNQLLSKEIFLLLPAYVSNQETVAILPAW